MSDSLEKAKAAAAKLEAAKRQAAQLKALQAEAELEIAKAEAAHAAEAEVAKNERAKQALHRAAEKQRLRKAKRAELAKQAALQKRAEQADAPAAARQRPEAVSETTGTQQAPTNATNAAADADVDFYDDDPRDGGYVDEPIDDFHEETGKRRKRIGLRCFNCNRSEGHYLLYYRRLWYSYIVGMTLGLAGIVGPYRCQCCGSSRLMVSNLLHPKYYASIMSTQSRSDKARSSRRPKKRRSSRER